jgi:hypothetical protein
LVILQQDVDVIKAETGGNVPRDEYSINMESDEVYIPASLSVKECKPEVSHVFR